MNVLADIVVAKHREVEQRRALRPLAELQSLVNDLPPTRDFLAPLRGAPPIRLIAEIKKASPSAGVIRHDFDPISLATAYQEGGANCLSVLTDEAFFQGNLAYLRSIRQQVHLPLLRKDFIVDPYQIYESRWAGADAILLIAECLTCEQLCQFYQVAREIDLAVLIELHDPQQLDNVLATGTELIGVNNRDLHTFKVDTEQTVRIKEAIPADRMVVGESGVKDRDVVLRWESLGVDAMLVGETLMRCPDVAAATRQLLGLESRESSAFVPRN